MLVLRAPPISATVRAPPFSGPPVVVWLVARCWLVCVGSFLLALAQAPKHSSDEQHARVPPALPASETRRDATNRLRSVAPAPTRLPRRPLLPGALDSWFSCRSGQEGERNRAVSVVRACCPARCAPQCGIHFAMPLPPGMREVFQHPDHVPRCRCNRLLRLPRSFREGAVGAPCACDNGPCSHNLGFFAFIGIPGSALTDEHIFRLFSARLEHNHPAAACVSHLAALKQQGRLLLCSGCRVNRPSTEAHAEVRFFLFCCGAFFSFPFVSLSLFLSSSPFLSLSLSLSLSSRGAARACGRYARLVGAGPDVPSQPHGRADGSRRLAGKHLLLRDLLPAVAEWPAWNGSPPPLWGAHDGGRSVPVGRGSASRPASALVGAVCVASPSRDVGAPWPRQCVLEAFPRFGVR